MIAAAVDSRQLSVALVYDDSLDRHGGVPQYLTMLGRGLARRSHRVTYLVGATSIERLGSGEVRSLARNVRVRCNGSAGTMPLISRERAVAAALAHGAFDVVHVQVPYSPFMAARVIRRTTPATAVVGTFHVHSEQTVAGLGARMLAAVSCRSLARFDAMLCVSEVARAFAHRRFGVTDAVVVPNMVDGPALRSMAAMRERSAHGGPALAFVGNLVPRKGVATLLAAMPAILSEHPRARLTIAGDGPLRRDLERMARKAGLGGTVRFAGTVSEWEKASLLADADVACFPSHGGESFGIVLLEAIAAGAGVVVAARNAGYAEVLRDVPQALCAPRDPADLARTVLRLLADPVLRGDVRARQQRIAERHDVDAITDLVLSHYRTALFSRGHAAAVVGTRPLTQLSRAR